MGVLGRAGPEGGTPEGLALTEPPVVLDRVETPRGELVLRSDGEHFEVISNGTFLMDTRAGASERLLVRAALQRVERPAAVLLGGLGVGFSLLEALADDRVGRVVVSEIEPTILSWHHHHLGAITASALADPRTEVVIGDVADLLRSGPLRYDAICLDVDNGPDWTVTTANASLYDDDGTALIARRLAAGGVLAVWSATRSAAYEDRLRRHVGAVEVHEIAVPRGEPDIVFVASAAMG